MQRRGRPLLGLVSGVIWGLGIAVLIQQFGWLPLNQYVLIGFPAGAALLSGLWSRRSGAVALLMFVPALVLAQADACEVTIHASGEEESILTGRGIGDPVVIPADFMGIEGSVNAPGSGAGEVWVEVGGVRIPRQLGSFEDNVPFSFSREELEPFVAPGLYHVGGSVEGVCSGSGYIRIEGSPLNNPIGQAAIGALIIGLLGTWRAGRREPPPRPIPTSVRPPRLRARLYDGETQSSLEHFVAGRSHLIKVDLQRGDSAAEDVIGGRMSSTRELIVVLTEPTMAPTPQVGVVAAAATTFRLDVPAEATEVDARLIALADNRILHTVRLPSTVAPSIDKEAESPPDTNVATAETTASVGSGGVEARPIDTALLVNHGRGRSHITGIADDDAAIVEVGAGDVAEAVEKIRTRLGEIVEQPEDFGALDDRGTVELLVFLAHHGRLMRNALVADFLRGLLADATALQVVSATPDAYFPFEFAYDFTAPDEDAALCPEALSTLLAPDPTIPCPGVHTQRTVCPLGFWGLTRVIERHAHQAGEILPVGFLVRSVPQEGRSRLSEGPVLFAASDRVDAVTPGAIRRLSASLTEATTGRTVEARGWKEWISDVAAGPALTILLPHTVYSDMLDTYGLEIGASDRSWAGEIDERFVPPEERPVITILLGCETAAAGRVSYERFPGLFRRAGAEVVFATLTEILGRHGAPMADALAREILTGWHSTSVRLGEVMLTLRRRLLAQGLTAVLAVVAFGDADWVLGEQPSPGGGVTSEEARAATSVSRPSRAGADRAQPGEP